MTQPNSVKQHKSRFIPSVVSVAKYDEISNLEEQVKKEAIYARSPLKQKIKMEDTAVQTPRNIQVTEKEINQNPHVS